MTITLWSWIASTTRLTLNKALLSWAFCQSWLGCYRENGGLLCRSSPSRHKTVPTRPVDTRFGQLFVCHSISTNDLFALSSSYQLVILRFLCFINCFIEILALANSLNVEQHFSTGCALFSHMIAISRQLMASWGNRQTSCFFCKETCNWLWIPRFDCYMWNAKDICTHISFRGRNCKYLGICSCFGHLSSQSDQRITITQRSDSLSFIHRSE